MEKKLWALFLLIGIIGLLGGCVSPAKSANAPSSSIPSCRSLSTGFPAMQWHLKSTGWDVELLNATGFEISNLAAQVSTPGLSGETGMVDQEFANNGDHLTIRSRGAYDIQKALKTTFNVSYTAKTQKRDFSVECSQG